MDWISLSLLAAIVWAVGNVLDKYVLSEHVKQAEVALLGFGVAGVIGAVIVYLTHGFFGVSQSFIVLSAISGLVYLGANWLYFTAVKAEEVSRVILVVYLDPLFTALLSAFTLGEIFSFHKYAGVVLLVLGATITAYRKSSGFRFSRGLVLAGISAFLFAVNNLLTKYLVTGSDFWTAFGYVRIFTCVWMLPLFYFYGRPMLELIKTDWRGAGLLAGSNILGQVGILSFAAATAVGYVTLVTALDSTQPLFVLIITIVLSYLFPKILQEQVDRKVLAQKVLALLLMFAGTLLVVK